MNILHSKAFYQFEVGHRNNGDHTIRLYLKSLKTFYFNHPEVMHPR